MSEKSIIRVYVNNVHEFSYETSASPRLGETIKLDVYVGFDEKITGTFIVNNVEHEISGHNYTGYDSYINVYVEEVSE